MIVVIPSACAVRLDYLQPLIDAKARFIVVDDSRGRIQIDHPQFEVYNWLDQKRVLGGLVEAIPRGNGACRDFGFLLAWWQSDPGEIVVALDDDCRIDSDDFASEVEAALTVGSRPRPLGAGRHWNVLDLYFDGPDRLFPRGFPYSNRAGYERCELGDLAEVTPVFSLGLWTGVFDINAIDKIEGPEFVHPEARLRVPSAIVPSGSLISVCSMNMVFRREVIPAAYQLPMAFEIMDGWRIDRYGDIWGGFVLKRLLDIRSDVMVAGSPMIRHLKEGRVDRNIWQEHIAHLVNDEFISLIEDFEGPATATYTNLIELLTDHVAEHEPELYPFASLYRARAWRARGLERGPSSSRTLNPDVDRQVCALSSRTSACSSNNLAQASRRASRSPRPWCFSQGADPMNEL